MKVPELTTEPNISRREELIAEVIWSARNLAEEEELQSISKNPIRLRGESSFTGLEDKQAAHCFLSALDFTLGTIDFGTVELDPKPYLEFCGQGSREYLINRRYAVNVQICLNFPGDPWTGGQMRLVERITFNGDDLSNELTPVFEARVSSLMVVLKARIEHELAVTPHIKET